MFKNIYLSQQNFVIRLSSESLIQEPYNELLYQ